MPRLARTPTSVKAELQRRGVYREYIKRQRPFKHSNENQSALRDKLIEEYLGPQWQRGPEYWRSATLPIHDVGDSSAPDVANDPKHERLNVRRDVNWVLSNLLQKQIRWQDAPSRIAYTLWSEYHPTKETRKTFLEKFAVKLLPSRAQMNEKETFADHGEKCEDAIRTALAFSDSGATENIISVLPSRPEGLQDESGVSGRDGEVRQEKPEQCA